MATDDQQKDRERLRRHVERHQLVSVMNDTKWREVCDALGRIPEYRVVFRVRCVRDAFDREPRREGSFPSHVPSYEQIEWLEVDPVVRTPRGALVSDHVRDFTGDVIAALQAVSVPFSIEDGYVRIWGYLRPGQTSAL